MDKQKDTSYIFGGRSLGSRIAELYESGKTEAEIAKELHVSTRYVHAVLHSLGLIE